MSVQEKVLETLRQSEERGRKVSSWKRCVFAWRWLGTRLWAKWCSVLEFPKTHTYFWLCLIIRTRSGDSGCSRHSYDNRWHHFPTTNPFLCPFYARAHLSATIISPSSAALGGVQHDCTSPHTAAHATHSISFLAYLLARTERYNAQPNQLPFARTEAFIFTSDIVLPLSTRPLATTVITAVATPLATASPPPQPVLQPTVSSASRKSCRLTDGRTEGLTNFSPIFGIDNTPLTVPPPACPAHI